MLQISHTLDENEIFVRLNQMRGIFALVVLFSHIWGYTGLVFLVPFNKAVTIAVAMFFFLSGYGMTRSSRLKGDYIKSIFSIKIPYLIYMATLAYIVSAIFQWILGIEDFHKELFLPIGFYNLIVRTNWYVYELIGFYILFAIASKIKNVNLRITFIFICSSIAFVWLFNSGLAEAYYNSIFGFLGGYYCKP